MAFSFPASPTNNQVYTLNGVSWIWTTATGAWTLLQPQGVNVIISTSAPSGTAANGTLWIKV